MAASAITAITYVTHNGIYYFPSFEVARAYALAQRLPTDRLICYQRGWAIQRNVSGPYYGPNGWS